jgi:hypothetical protein
MSDTQFFSDVQSAYSAQAETVLTELGIWDFDGNAQPEILDDCDWFPEFPVIQTCGDFDSELVNS